jgi:hypothetical protein
VNVGKTTENTRRRGKMFLEGQHLTVKLQDVLVKMRRPDGSAIVLDVVGRRRRRR